MNAAVTLRRARRDETAAMTDLCIRSKRSNGYDDAFMAQCLDELAVREGDLDDGEFWVAEAGSGLAGLACWCRDPDGRIAELTQLYVAPESQRTGIGRKLAEKVLERARATGVVRIVLDADPFAVPFYEALGFRVTGQSASGSIPGRILPHMAMALADAG
jgi:GNAT superfamily N-acetyltransferase